MKKKKYLRIGSLLLFIIGTSSLIFIFSFVNKSPLNETSDINSSFSNNKSQENRVSIIAVGDNMGHDYVYNKADERLGTMGDDKYDFVSLYKYVSTYISEADIACINQESILGGDHLGLSTYPRFNSPAAWAKDLVGVGFDVVCGANNHMLDMGIEGIINSHNTWSEFDEITYLGAYISKEDSATIRVIEKDNIKVSFLAYTYGMNGIQSPNDYSCPTFDEEKITKDIALAKTISDVVVVFAHWGNEYNETPSSFQNKYAKLFADLEVDVVIGTHPHVIQPIEWVEGANGNKTLVAYSLGNFVSAQDSVDTQLEIMLSFEIVKSDNNITLDNISVIPVINHFGNGEACVIPLKDYTNELGKQHWYLKDLLTNAKDYYDDKVKKVISDEFLKLN